MIRKPSRKSFMRSRSCSTTEEPRTVRTLSQLFSHRDRAGSSTLRTKWSRQALTSSTLRVKPTWKTGQTQCRKQVYTMSSLSETRTWSPWATCSTSEETSGAATWQQEREQLLSARSTTFRSTSTLPSRELAGVLFENEKAHQNV